MARFFPTESLLVEERSPEVWADAVAWVLDEERATSLSTNAVILAQNYTWRAAAERVRDLSAQLRSSALVTCP